MNEAETRAEHIDPALKAAGWGVVEGSRIRREYVISPGRLQGHGQRAKPEIADYILEYRNHKLAVVEAKAWDFGVSEGLTQAKSYAGKLAVRFAYSTNGQGIYGVDLKTGMEGDIASYPTPEELWELTFSSENKWRDRFAEVPFPDKSGTWALRYYQEIAVNRVLDRIAAGKDRVLLTLATGTGKTSIAFQIAWKLFQSRWNLGREPTRRPRILFLADRNTLATQAYNDFTSFAAFADDALVRVKPEEIRAKGKVPKNASVFFTIFQTFMASAGSATGASAGSATEESPAKVTEIKPAAGYMYILRCADGSFYTGSTTDLHTRLEQHRTGEGARHTGIRLPVELIYYETFARIDKAFGREKQVQGWSRAKKIALIKGHTDELPRLARGSVPEPVEGGSAPEPVEGYFGEYPPDFFDFIVIDECHRGGANDESSWREIMEYFSPAVQLGLTATPKRIVNTDTYKYFGEPVFIYSLKEGVNDGFLTPFKVKQIATTLDDYVYTPDDRVMEGDVEAERRYVEADFNKIIEIMEREKKRVEIFMKDIDQREKTLVFCATQLHALAVRDLINQMKTSKDPNYCARVTANEGARGDQFLREFQDNEKTIPTILTTSQKLSTGVDARNVRNIVLMRPINSMIEFKQIIGRGTRLYDGKDYFTIYDFVKAHQHFNDPEWDGEPIEPEPRQPRPPTPEPPQPPGGEGPGPKPPTRERIKIRLADGKERLIQHMMSTSFWSPDGKPMTAEEFLKSLYGKLPDFFKSEEELRHLWSDPATRKTLLEGLAEKGYGRGALAELQRLIDAEKSDLYDVLAYVAYLLPTITRQERATRAKLAITAEFNAKQQVFLDFVLSQYVSIGVDELASDKLSALLKLKYDNAIADAVADLGQPAEINRTFISFQKYLYERAA